MPGATEGDGKRPTTVVAFVASDRSVRFAMPACYVRSFLLLVVRHLLLVAMHLLLVASCYSRRRWLKIQYDTAYTVETCLEDDSLKKVKKRIG